MLNSFNSPLHSFHQLFNHDEFSIIYFQQIHFNWKAQANNKRLLMLSKYLWVDGLLIIFFFGWRTNEWVSEWVTGHEVYKRFRTDKSAGPEH